VNWGGGPMKQRIIALWNEGDGHQAAGRFADAERCFRDVAELMPDNPHPLDRIAQVLRDQGRLEEAWDVATRAVATGPGEPVFHNTAATIADVLGRADRAAVHYRRALLLAPGLGLWAPLASLYFRSGDYPGAACAYGRALALTSGDGALTFERAAALHRSGDAAAATRGYREALAEMPDHEPTFRNLAVLAREAGDAKEAEHWLRKALVIRPANADLLREFGVMALNRGDAARAFAVQRRVLRLTPDDAMSWGALSDAARRLNPTVPDAGGLIDIADCISRGVGTPGQLIGTAIALLHQEPGFLDACREAAGTEAGELARRIADGGLPACIDTDILRRLLRLSLLPDPEIEAGLTGIRGALLELAAAGALEGLGSTHAFVLALAEQCQLNEHAWYESSEESRRIVTLEKKLAKDRRWSMPALLLACYRRPEPRDPSGDPRFEHFEQANVQSRVREQAIAEALPALTPIADETSAAVRAQYEENPYPRWASLPRGRPARAPETEPDDAEILIAGCGTGQHALLAALIHHKARILAVDLSRASLAYAERRRREYGLDNVTFAQADILDLGTLERRFDVIESIGVLHHMADPVAGWRVLTGLLKPGGTMKIGLYSEAARRPVVRAREKIAGWGLDGSASAIREARRRLMRDRGDPALAVLFFSPDF
jgi:tetratricopeptide (TPR) repeat protein/SAM-dependent methyltransferase